MTELIPSRTVLGDTVVVEGRGFGDAQGTSTVAFASTARSAGAPIVTWTDDEITVLVPDGAVDGGVVVRVGDVEAEALDFAIAPSVVSLSVDVYPLLETYQCLICHSTTNPGGGFRISDADLLIDYPSMFSSGTQPPNIRPRRSGESEFIRRLLSSTPEGSRMPQGGFPNFMFDDEILILSDWIDQGARNN